MLDAGSSRPNFFGQTEFRLTLWSDRDTFLVMVNGSSKVAAYESRLQEIEGVLYVFCKHCNEWQISTEFHKQKGLYKSICKSCHRSRYNKAAGYESPSARRKRKESERDKEQWLSEHQTCTMCGDTKERREFYNEQQKRYLPYCCSTRRTWEQIERDISEQMKTCFGCGLRLPFDEYAYSPNGRDKKRPYCNCCLSAIRHSSPDKQSRQQAIDATSDGSASVPALSKMLRDASNCSHCGVELTQSYPVKPTQRTLDHTLPLSRGGKHTLSNISVMCLSCNSAKQDRTIEEFSRVKKKIAL